MLIDPRDLACAIRNGGASVTAFLPDRLQRAALLERHRREALQERQADLVAFGVALFLLCVVLLGTLWPWE